VRERPCEGALTEIGQLDAPIGAEHTVRGLEILYASDDAGII
jgi:hypothetical protein